MLIITLYEKILIDNFTKGDSMTINMIGWIYEKTMV
jgi:hypothetical protein